MLGVGGGGERGIPLHPCGNRPRDLIFKARQGRASWLGTKPRASGRGMSSVTPPPPPHTPGHTTVPLGQGPEGWGRRKGGPQYMGVLRVAWPAVNSVNAWGVRLEGAENGMMGPWVAS